MRKVINLQVELWKKNIGEIEFDFKSRDEIPKLLIGLQYISQTPEICDQVFNILKTIVPERSLVFGRQGMDLWKILVLGTLRLNCNWDYDKVCEMANNHFTIRQMLGHSKTDFHLRYPLQTIKDNIVLLTPQVLDEINQVVVKAGHNLISPQKILKLMGSCDSFVVETNVHFPTDINLLFNCMCKIISIIAAVCSEMGLTLWRQYKYNISKIKELLYIIQRLRSSKAKDSLKIEKREELIVSKYQEYIKLCHDLVLRAKKTIEGLREYHELSSIQDLRLDTIEKFIQDAERQIDQTIRRVVHKEKIPHKEKVFSIFEPHTEWIKKGKAGVSQELGLNVCVLKDEYGFILYHQVMEKQIDKEIAASMAQEAKNRFENLFGCSFDKGFYTQDNRKELTDILDYVVLPKKGRLSEKDKEIEHSQKFIYHRRKHSAVESSINALENHGLDRCPDHGIDGFKRYVALAVLGRNIQILGHIIQQKKLKRKAA